MARRETGADASWEDYFVLILLFGACGVFTLLGYYGVIMVSFGTAKSAYSPGVVEMYTVANPAVLGREYHSGLMYSPQDATAVFSWGFYSGRYFNASATGWSLPLHQLLGWWPHQGQIISPDPLLVHEETMIVARWQWSLNGQEARQLVEYLQETASAANAASDSLQAQTASRPYDDCRYSWMGLGGETSASWALDAVKRVTMAQPQVQCQPRWLPSRLREAQRNLFAWPSNCLEVSE